MKLSEDSLFWLVHSISATEESQFKKHVRGKLTKGDSAYLTLFNVMKKLDTYDAKELQNKIKGANTSKTKQYLYQALLEFLVKNDRTGHPIALKVEMQCHKAKVLYYKGLYKEAMNTISEAKKEAVKYNLYNLLINAIDLEIPLISETYKDNLPNYLRKVFIEKTEARKMEAIIDQYRYMFAYVLYFSRKGTGTKDTASHAALNKVVQSDMFLNQDYSDLPFLARYYYHMSHINYYILINDIEKQFDQHNKVFKLWSRFPDMKKGMDNQYYGWLPDFLYLKGICKDFSNLGDVMEEIRMQNISQPLKEVRYINSINVVKSKFALWAGDTNASISYAKAATQAKLIPESSMAPITLKLVPWMQLSVIYFIRNDFQKAYYYLNKIDAHHPVLVKRWLIFISIIRIRRMMLAFEKGDLILLQDLYKANKKYFSRKRTLINQDIIILFMQFFKKIIPLHDVRKIQQAFNTFKNEVLQNKLQRKIEFFIGFDVTIWLDSKVTNKPMELLLKERAEKDYPEIFEIKI